MPFAIVGAAVAVTAAMPAAAEGGASACTGLDAAAVTERYRRSAASVATPVEALLPDAFPSFEWPAGGRVVARLPSGAMRVFDARNGRELDAGTTPPDDAGTADGPYRVVQQGYDLELLDVRSGDRTAITRDGTRDLAYGVVSETGSHPLTKIRNGRVPEVFGRWSPDARYFVTSRVDQSGLREFPYVVAGAPGANGHRLPEAHVFRHAYPGDAKVPTASLVAFDRPGRSLVELDVPPLFMTYGAPDSDIVWTEDSRYFFVGESSRDFRSRTIHRVDPRTGRSNRAAVDRSEDKPLRPYGSNPAFAPVGRGNELVLVSDQDGRAHLYVFDAESGRRLRQLTAGAWSVVDIEAVDSRGRLVYFTAVGREAGRDPYYRHLYRVALDGGPVELLTPEDADHEVHLAPSLDRFVDVHSTVDRAPVVVLRGSSGAGIATLWRVDAGPLVERGWRAPRRFAVTAADGRTTLHGTLHLPAAVEGRACAPILDSIYAGPQRVYAPVRFPGDAWGFENALAQVGFVVFMLDARGTPLLAREARDATWGAGFGSDVVAADHAAAIRQIAERYGQADADRAGVYGHSWGGYYTVRVMAQRPDVFKAGVAGAGSHDNFVYSFEHERWFGSFTEHPDSYRLQSNLPLAPQVRGDLLLVHGNADDDVHPLNTILMAGALAKANRPFSMLVLPDLNHDGSWWDGYAIKRRWDHFVERLLGVAAPADVEITAINPFED